MSSLACTAYPVNAAKKTLPTFTTLTPGTPTTIEQDLNINVVFIGFDDEWIDEDLFESWMLEEYQTIIRSRTWYGILEPLGLEFSFDYNYIFADNTFTGELFDYIKNVASYPGSLYSRQTWYNGLPAEERAGYAIMGPNYYVNAPDIEQWLEENAAAEFGIDPVNTYTIFFLNGFDYYDGFAHSYQYVDEPNPDTGAIFGLYGSRQMTGWGGQFGRSWFIDLSAGPDRFLFQSATATYEDAVRPIWEYQAYDGYRTNDDLTLSLAYLTRFVGIDLLFTPSPIYPTYLQPPLLPETIQFDVNMFQQAETYIGEDWFDPTFMASAYEEFLPFLDFSVSFQNRQLDDPLLTKVFENWASDNPYSVFGKKSPYYWAADSGIDFHLYFKSHLFQYMTATEGSSADYTIPIFSYAIEDDYLGDNFGLGGYADDNWLDGTQEYIYTFNTPYWAEEVGYGFTQTAIHEAGHHIGLSHPHDGWDPVYQEVAYLGAFANAGDHSFTVMNYHDVTSQFGQFNQDSMYRYLTITYLNYANKMLASIIKSPQVEKVAGMLSSADADAQLALEEYQDMNYEDAVVHMKNAYDTIVDASMLLKIPLEQNNWHATYKGRTITLYDPLLPP